MPEEETTLYLLVIVIVVAVVGLGVAVASFATNQSVNRMMGGGGGGMMGSPTTNTTSAPGGLEWGVLVVSAAFLVIAVALVLVSRRPRRQLETAPPMVATSGAGFVAPPSPAPSLPTASAVPTVPSAAPAPAPAVAEPTLVKLLDEDERRMYLVLRDHGGEMYQRDLVASGMFSKAKVTRVLDKLEAKGLVVREAHGMTNRVRLVQLPAK